MFKFIAGIATGVGIGILIAPATGEETRRNLMEQARNLPQRAKDLAQAPQRKANEMLDQVPEKAADIASQTARKAAESAVGSVRQKTGLPDTGTKG